MTNGKMCLLEKVIMKSGFVLVHDGQRNPGQFILPPEEIKCFTRKYRLKSDGEFLNTWIVFKYDQRSQMADFEIYSREPETAGREKMVLGEELSKVIEEEEKKEVESHG